nr:hypothetical protein BgiMline_027247 [Biomphalaria glabrata]
MKGAIFSLKQRRSLQDGAFWHPLVMAVSSCIMVTIHRPYTAQLCVVNVFNANSVYINLQQHFMKIDRPARDPVPSTSATSLDTPAKRGLQEIMYPLPQLPL